MSCETATQKHNITDSEFSSHSAHFGLSDLPSGIDLDAYLVELEKRMAQDDDEESSAKDILVQLQQKERDLLLAAELGKALLERNEELSKRQETLSKDYSIRVEELEQERHALKRRLDAIEGEYENRMSELQNDLNYVQKQLQQKEHMFREVDEDRSRLITELSEQNQRLTLQLKEAQRIESQLTADLEKLREQFNARKGTAGDHAKQLELLKEEINVLSEKKSDFERRLQNITVERDTLLINLEEANEQIAALDRRNREQEYRIVLQDRDLIELKHNNSRLEDQVEELRSQSGSSHGTSLLNELEAAQSAAGSDFLGDQLGLKSAGNGSCIDDDDSPASITNEIAHDYKLSQDMMSTYEQLQKVCSSLLSRQENENPTDAENLRPMIEELKSFINDISRRQTENEFVAKAELKTLSRELELEKEKSKSLQEQLEAHNRKTKIQHEEIESLTSQLSLRDTEFTVVRSENFRLKEEQALLSQNQDEIVKKAREDRDLAIARQNTLELEMTKSKMDFRSLSNQLMEAIEQKIELSQQLEAWQVDMQSMLNDQLKERLHQEEQRRRKYKEEVAEQKLKAKKFALWR